jgi:hypothetical protein
MTRGQNAARAEQYDRDRDGQQGVCAGVSERAGG